MNEVYIKKTSGGYDLQKMKGIIADIINESAFLEEYDFNSKILLKPNLVSPLPIEKAATTNPLFVEAVVLCLMDFGYKNITIGESGLQNTFEIFTVTGILDIANKYDVDIIHFDKYGSINVENKGNSFLINIPYSEKIPDFDIIINLPKLKIHHAFVYTGAVKNMYGTLPGRNKLRLHAEAKSVGRFEDVIVDVFENLKVNFSFMDGIVGHEGNGPCNGHSIETGLILASSSGLALDIVATDMIGIDYKQVGYLLKYYNRHSSFSVTRVNMDKDIKVNKIQYKKPNLIFQSLPTVTKVFQPFIRLLFKPIPKFNEINCTNCNLCVNHCPVNALEKSENYPKLHKKKCISCFCCQEACMSDAINRSDIRD